MLREGLLLPKLLWMLMVPGAQHSRSGAQQDLGHVADLMLLWDVLGLERASKKRR